MKISPRPIFAYLVYFAVKTFLSFPPFALLAPFAFNNSKKLRNPRLPGEGSEFRNQTNWTLNGPLWDP